MRYPDVVHQPTYLWGHDRMGSLAGAARLLDHTAGVLWLAQCGRKPHLEYKDIS